MVCFGDADYMDSLHASTHLIYSLNALNLPNAYM